MRLEPGNLVKIKPGVLVRIKPGKTVYVAIRILPPVNGKVGHKYFYIYPDNVGLYLYELASPVASDPDRKIDVILIEEAICHVDEGVLERMTVE
ncbi:MAG: hypothetical protein WC761_01825 [Candidatus Paceibacterota bacterium]|jgi:hypothetical protein